MEMDKKFELDDEALDGVAGGAGVVDQTYTGKYDGHAVTLSSAHKCAKCGGTRAIVFHYRKDSPYYVGVCDNPGCGGDMGTDAAAIMLKRPAISHFFESEVVADHGKVLF